MSSYLIDTDWIIDYLKGRRKIIERLNALSIDSEELAISIISLAELYEGVFSSREPERQMNGLRDFLQGVTIIGISDEIAKLFGQHRSLLRKSGQLIDNFDLLIGVTCLHYDLTLLTDNVQHFTRIPGLKIETQ